MKGTVAAPDTEGSAVVVTKLDFTYDGMDKPVLKKFDLDLPKGSRCDVRGGGGIYGAQARGGVGVRGGVFRSVFVVFTQGCATGPVCMVL